jgi:hypothetical protein
MPVTRVLRIGGVALALSASTFVTTARADDPSATRCSEAYVAGQHLQRDGKLIEAARKLLVCARSPCPAALQPECAEWLANVQRATPSIVIRATTARGQDVGDARVLVDGRPFLDRLDGAPHELDPGEHQVRVEPAVGPAVEQRVLLSSAEKSRLLTVVIPEAPAPVVAPVDTAPAPSRRPAFAFGGAGLAATGAFVYFGATGLSLWNECHVGCAASHVDAGNRAWIGADVSLGVALASFGLATYFFLRPGPKATARIDPSPIHLAADVSPFGARVRGAF